MSRSVLICKVHRKVTILTLKGSKRAAGGKNLVLPMEETNLGTFHKIWGARIKRAQAKLNLTGAQPPKRGGAMAPVPPYYPPELFRQIKSAIVPRY